MQRRTFVLNLLWLAAAAGCRSVPPLAHTHASAESVGHAMLEALARGDRPALEALALSEQEFRDHVWEDLPVARPERNLPFSYVWGELRQKSRNGLAGTLTEQGGRRYQLRRVVFEGLTEYPRSRVHRGAVFHVVDDRGEEQELRLCGSLLEQAGAWKVFSYVVD